MSHTTTPPPGESYTQMAAATTSTSTSTSVEADVDSIGRHCQYEYCHQLDFLPFRCESCRGTFCLDHRTETAHSCPRAGEWARRRNNPNQTQTQTQSGVQSQKPTIYNSDQCAHVSCKTLINTLKDPGVRCPNCNRQYCLKHRLKEGHDCVKTVPLGARPGPRTGTGTPNETIRSMFAKVRGWGGSNGAATSAKDNKSSAAKTTTLNSASSATPASSGLISRFGSKKASSSSAAARTLQLNSLKKSAKGDPSVPVDKRLYLHVEGTAERKVSDSVSPPPSSDSDSNKPKTTKPSTSTASTTTMKMDPPSGDFWFDSRWKVGRVLDDAARRLKIENVNNRVDGEEARLRVFHVESGEFLEFGMTIGGEDGKVKQGDTIVLLRGAGAVLGR